MKDLKIPRIDEVAPNFDVKSTPGPMKPRATRLLCGHLAGASTRSCSVRGLQAAYANVCSTPATWRAGDRAIVPALAT